MHGGGCIPCGGVHLFLFKCIHLNKKRCNDTTTSLIIYCFPFFRKRSINNQTNNILHPSLVKIYVIALKLMSRENRGNPYLGFLLLNKSVLCAFVGCMVGGGRLRPHESRMHPNQIAPRWRLSSGRWMEDSVPCSHEDEVPIVPLFLSFFFFIYLFR
jgi:hypothetical protein